MKGRNEEEGIGGGKEWRRKGMEKVGIMGMEKVGVEGMEKVGIMGMEEEDEREK